MGDPGHAAHDRVCGSARRERSVPARRHEPRRFDEPEGTRLLSAGGIQGRGDVVRPKRGYMVVAPSGTGYGAAALDDPERGLYSLFFSKVGSCDNPNFRDAGRAVALIDKWIIEYMTDQKLIVPDNVIVVGQSAGGWAAIALSSENLPGVRAIVAFAAGRGGRVGGKPNNNCAPDRLVAATGEFGRTARTPMLWIYIENDTFFGPELSRRMHEAYTGAGGNAEYHLLPPFGSDGHFLVSSPDGLPFWTPLVAAFLDKHR